jgi:Flp pilus assembly protein protease CpaA
MKFSFLRNKDLYSRKELICNWLVAFGWIIGLIIALITSLCSMEYIKSIGTGIMVFQPVWMQPLYSVSFIFFFLSMFGGVFKFIYSRKRKNGKLLSINDEKRRITR